MSIEEKLVKCLKDNNLYYNIITENDYELYVIKVNNKEMAVTVAGNCIVGGFKYGSLRISMEKETNDKVLNDIMNDILEEMEKSNG